MPRSTRAVLIALVLFAAFSVYMAFSTSLAEPAKLVSPTVEVTLEGGHGSGVHIGGGFIITAAHVADHGYADETLRTNTVQIKTQDGGMQWGRVEWVNKQFDVALIRIWSYKGIGVAEISRHALSVGDEIRFEGSPYDLGPVVTYGHVAAKEAPMGSWARAIMVDGTIRPGMSGGPVFDPSGRLVGINVGLPIRLIGMGIPDIGVVCVIVPIDAFEELLPH